MFFIKENDKPNFFAKMFNIIKMKGNVLILPLFDFLLSKKLSKRKIEKIAKKTKKIIEKNSTSKKIIVSKYLKKQITYINYLNQYGLKIQDGRILFEILISQIVDFIVEKADKTNVLNEKNKIIIENRFNKTNMLNNKNKIKNIDNINKNNKINVKEIYRNKVGISILVNDIDEYIFENIKILALKYQMVNIVSNHSEKLKRLENIMLDKNGVIITTINNKKKSLINSNIIVNIDFPSELLNKYFIKDDATIINIKTDAIVLSKRFSGTIINDYEIIFKDCNFLKENIDEKFYNKDIYEGTLYTNQRFSEINKNLLNDNVSILYLNTIHGKII